MVTTVLYDTTPNEYTKVFNQLDNINPKQHNFILT